MVVVLLLTDGCWFRFGSNQGRFVISTNGCCQRNANCASKPCLRIGEGASPWLPFPKRPGTSPQVNRERKTFIFLFVSLGSGNVPVSGRLTSWQNQRHARICQTRLGGHIHHVMGHDPNLPWFRHLAFLQKQRFMRPIRTRVGCARAAKDCKHHRGILTMAAHTLLGVPASLRTPM